MVALGRVGAVSVTEALLDIPRFRLMAQGPIEGAAVEHRIEGRLRGMAGELDDVSRVIRRARTTFAELECGCMRWERRAMKG